MATEGPPVIGKHNWIVIKPHFTLYSIRGMKWKMFVFIVFILLGEGIDTQKRRQFTY